MQTYSNDGAEFEAAALASKPSRTLAIRRPIRVWNGIFAARDRRAKRNLMTMSPRRDRESETTGRGKWPQKRPFCLRAIYCWFGKIG